MSSQANVRVERVLRSPTRALPSVIVDTEKVLREAMGPQKRAVPRPELRGGWKGVRPRVRLKNRTVRAGRSPKNTSAMSGNFIYRHHVEPRFKLYSPREESFPIPLTYIDVSRTTHTNWMSSKRSAPMIIGISMDLETCQILGQVSHNLLYWKKNLPTDICGPRGD